MDSSCDSTATSPPPPKRRLRQVVKWTCFTSLYALSAAMIVWAAIEIALECDGGVTIGQWVVIIRRTESAV